MANNFIIIFGCSSEVSYCYVMSFGNKTVAFLIQYNVYSAFAILSWSCPRLRGRSPTCHRQPTIHPFFFFFLNIIIPHPSWLRCNSLRSSRNKTTIVTLLDKRGFITIFYIYNRIFYIYNRIFYIYDRTFGS
jgi:hypothetical protein